jgi:hypothetical protein
MSDDIFHRRFLNINTGGDANVSPPALLTTGRSTHGYKG